MTIQHILRLRTRLHKSLRRVFKHAIMRVDEDIQMGETSDNDDDLRSELNDDDDDERVGSMEPLRVGGEAAVAAVLERRARCPGDRTHTHTRTCTNFCWLNTHIYTPTHGPVDLRSGASRPDVRRRAEQDERMSGVVFAGSQSQTDPRSERHACTIRSLPLFMCLSLNHNG